jgi:osmotically-inducible protein OsmY
MSDADSELPMEQAEALLRRRLGAWVCDVRVLARDGGVVLQGRVRSYYAKQLAQQVVMQGLRLPVAANEIEVLWAPPAPDSGGAEPE